LEGGQPLSSDFIDKTLVPLTDNFDIDQSISQEFFPSDRVTNNCNVINKRDMAPNSIASLDNLFPSPGIIIKDIYEIYKTNKLVKERDSAVLNYLNFLFKNSI